MIAPENRRSNNSDKGTPRDRRTQEEQLKAMGYRFDPTRKAWVRGDNSRREAECRSGRRTLAVVNADGSPARLPPHFRDALNFLEQRIKEARQRRLGETVGAGGESLNAMFLECVTHPWASWTWFQWHAILMAVLVSSGSVDLDSTVLVGSDQLVPSLSLAALSLPVMLGARRVRDAAHPGLEDNQGTLERCLVDHKLGSLALPAVPEWRAEPQWRVTHLAYEALASLTALLFWHGGVQPMATEGVRQLFLDPTQRAFGLPLDGTWEQAAVACGAVLTTLAMVAFDELPGRVQSAWSDQPSPEVEGMEAELGAARAALTSAAAWASMNQQKSAKLSQSVEEQQHAAAVAEESRRALEKMSQIWISKFEGGVADRALRLRGTSFVAAATLSALTAATGGALLAPWLAKLAASGDRALFPNADVGRAVVQLDDLRAPSGSGAEKTAASSD